jgi:hypothetical protein
MGTVIYIGSDPAIPFTAVGEVVEFIDETVTLVCWNNEFISEVTDADLAIGG